MSSKSTDLIQAIGALKEVYKGQAEVLYSPPFQRLEVAKMMLTLGQIEDSRGIVENALTVINQENVPLSKNALKDMKALFEKLLYKFPEVDPQLNLPAR